jgi:predicted transcriptional regulator YheO
MDIMDIASRLVDFLGKAYGETCEVVLQDLRPGKMCVAAIANGRISGRSVGAPLTDLALRLIAQEVWKTKDYICNYEGRTRDNRPLHSSTFFIKNEGKLLGMLSVNVDVSRYTRISGEIMRLAGLTPLISQPAAAGGQTENFYDNMEEIVKSVFKELKAEGSPEQLSQAARLAIIERLIDRGIFLLKGSVSTVAEKLRCSEATLYRYISMITRKRRENHGGTAGNIRGRGSF